MCARDPFGVKPLYWRTDGRRVAVASEVRALLAAGLAEPRVDRVALDHYLACRFVPAPRTLFEGISKLPAGHRAHGRDRTSRAAVTQLPRGPRRDRSPTSKGDELADELADRFTDAVERQMMSDVPYGAFLSGGVDSAAIAAAMAQRSDAPPTTFTIGFPGHGDELDEREYAAESAELIGTDHHDTAMAQSDFLAELERCVRHLEEPCGIPSAPALMQLSRFAAQDVKVVLSGQGADEPHGGYGRHQAAAALGLAGQLGPLGRAAARRRGPGEAQRAGAPRRAGCSGDMAPAERLVRLIEITDDDAAHGAAGQRRRGGRGGAHGAGARTCWPTWATAGWSSRRSTSTPTCSCPTAC